MSGGGLYSFLGPKILAANHGLVEAVLNTLYGRRVGSGTFTYLIERVRARLNIHALGRATRTRRVLLIGKRSIRLIP